MRAARSDARTVQPSRSAARRASSPRRTRNAWPWRAVEAMALGIPLVAVDSPVHREVIYDGGLFVPEGDLGDALRTTLGAGRERLRVLGQDRSRAFTWTRRGREGVAAARRSVTAIRRNPARVERASRLTAVRSRVAFTRNRIWGTAE